jgi:prophage regulatory protein
MTDKIIRKPEVSVMTGLPHSTLYRLIKNGTFPAPFKIGERASGWLLSEVQSWMATRAQTHRKDPNNANGDTNV